MQVVPGPLGIFEQEQKLGADGGPGECGGGDSPAERRGERISETVAEQEEDAKGGQIGERLEKKVRMDDAGAEVEINGKADGELG